MNLQESIRRILREETKSGKYTRALEIITNVIKKEDFVCDIEVKYYGAAGTYEVIVKIDKKEMETNFEKLSIWYAEKLIKEYLSDLRKKVEKEIRDFLPVKVLVYIDQFSCNKKLNESEEKKSRLLSNIEENGLYEVVSSTGLHINEIEQKVGQLSREVLERFIKDVVKEHFQVIDDDGKTYIIYLEDYPFDVVPIGNSDYVEQLRVIDNKLIFVVALYDEDEYGDQEFSSEEFTPSKNLLYMNIYEIAGQLGFLLSKGRI